MGADDKTQNKVQEVKGDAKEKIGQVTGDDEMRHEGQQDQAKANLKQAGENVKDALKKA